jgi:Xaa-Pro aminopeptidase
VERGLTNGAAGIVGLADAIAAEHLRQIAATVPTVRLHDATRLFEDVRQVKSAEEIANLRGTSAIFQKILRASKASCAQGSARLTSPAAPRASPNCTAAAT